MCRYCSPIGDRLTKQKEVVDHRDRKGNWGVNDSEGEHDFGVSEVRDWRGTSTYPEVGAREASAQLSKAK